MSQDLDDKIEAVVEHLRSVRTWYLAEIAAPLLALWMHPALQLVARNDPLSDLALGGALCIAAVLLVQTGFVLQHACLLAQVCLDTAPRRLALVSDWTKGMFAGGAFMFAVAMGVHPILRDTWSRQSDKGKVCTLLVMSIVLLGVGWYISRTKMRAAMQIVTACEGGDSAA